MTNSHLPQFDSRVAAWLEELGLNPPQSEHPDWGFKLSFSTVRPFDWTVRRSKIGPSELWFGVGLSRLTGWTAALFPRDEAFRVTWRSDETMDVKAQSVLLRHRTPWPPLPSLNALPHTIESIEKILGRRFHRTAEFFGPSLKSSDFPALAEWLRPLSDEIVFTLGTVHGPLPEGAGAEVEDNRKEDGGVTVKLRLAR